MTLDEMIAVLEAAKRGEQIQHRAREFEDWDWSDSPDPTWDFDSYDYRVKPRGPRVRYLLEFANGHTYDRVYETHKRAEEVASLTTDSRVIEFREVLP